jgi:O-antigen ligase
MVVPMMLAVADNIPAEWRWRKHIVLSYRLAVPLTLYAAISTFSRGGLLAIVAGGFVFVLLQARRRLGTVLLIGLAGLIVLPFVPMPKGYEERMQTIVTYQQAGETSAISRLHFWKVAVDMVIDKPLGVGMYNFNSTYDQYDFLHGQFGTERSVHSSHFEALAENGFFGFAVWIGLFIMAIRSCLRVRKLAMTRLQGTPEGTFFWTMGGAMIISMVAFLVGGSFIALTLNDLTWITFGLVAALETICLKTVSERAGEPVGRGVRRGPVRPVRPRPVRTPPPLPSPRRTTQQRPEHVSRPPP